MPVHAEKFRWTVERYHRAIDAGVLTPDEQFELIDGELLTVVPSNPPHAQTIRRLEQHFYSVLDLNRFVVSSQLPLDLGRDCQPEPDVMIAKGPANRYDRRHPISTDVLLLIEVGDTSIEYDREVKVPLYAKHHILEVWLADINARLVDVYRVPAIGGYRDITRHSGGVLAPLEMSQLELEVDVDAVFGISRRS